jgi:phosphocarrier protein HPr
MTSDDFFGRNIGAAVHVEDDALVRELQIVNRKGLHARATAKFVQCVEAFDAEVTVSRCGETVGGTSIMGILTLGAGQGSTITVSVKGPAATKALAAIATLVAGRFGEDE